MTTAAAEKEQPKGHPLGLYILFGTEMWERFSYYGMRALLVLYLIQVQGMQPSESSNVYKWYTSLVYLTPLIGGFLADRVLGLRISIVIGGALMAAGQFLLTRDQLPIFYTGLGLLIVGNGFFKPNISTLVGKMYKQGDPRRDGAFTIFYMGINLGALFSPIVCGQWLRAHYGFKYGFAAAGFGMLLGLVNFVLGQKWVLKAVEAAGNTLGVASKEETKAEHHEPAAADAQHAAEDETKPRASGIAGMVATVLPWAMITLAVVVPARYIYRYVTHQETLADVFMPVAFSAIAAWMAVTLLSIKGAARDKSTVIFSLFVFVVLFWMAFEQAGNALNLWAEFHTQRQVLFFDMEAESYQSINALAIVVLAPVFAMMWVGLARRGKEPSTPLKMAIAMVFVALSFVAMVGAAIFENQGEARVQLQGGVPAGVDLSKLDAGRMRFDAASHELVVKGVLASYVVNAALEQADSPAYVTSVGTFYESSQKASADHPVSGRLADVPSDFALPFDEKDRTKLGARWDAAEGTLTVTAPLEAPAKVALIGAGAPSTWRSTLKSLAKSSDASRASGFWLFLSYILATLGELCLSPVGLSMVTKLAPARFASLFMGVWLLSSSVAQYAGGSIGESWGSITPTAYFNLFVVSSLIGAVILFVLVVPLKRLMHDVT